MNRIQENPQQKARSEQLRLWLNQQLPLLASFPKAADFDVQMVSGDASFRRYFRVSFVSSEGSVQTCIAVDAPPQHENSQQFCKVAALLLQQGCFVPEVLASDFGTGFMLLSDLGDRQLLSELNAENVEHYYALAFEQLLKMQAMPIERINLPLYSHEMLMTEMALLQEWFCTQFLGLNLTNENLGMIERTQAQIAKQVGAQVQVFVHRDFHSRNLMIVGQQLAMIDFQDAVIGAVTYDAVSLLKDCYIEWPETQRKKWLHNYFEKLVKQGVLRDTATFDAFYKDFEWMGLQRHLKVLGIFARLSIRDGKHGYLKDLPLTFSYVEQALASMEELAEFRQWFLAELKPAFESKLASL